MKAALKAIIFVILHFVDRRYRIPRKRAGFVVLCDIVRGNLETFGTISSFHCPPEYCIRCGVKSTLKVKRNAQAIIRGMCVGVDCDTELLNAAMEHISYFRDTCSCVLCAVDREIHERIHAGE